MPTSRARTTLTSWQRPGADRTRLDLALDRGRARRGGGFRRRGTAFACSVKPREYWHHNTKSHPLADRHGTGGKMAWKDGLRSNNRPPRRETRLNATPPKFPIPSEPVRLARRVLAAAALSRCRR